MHEPPLLTEDSLAAFLNDLGDLSALPGASRDSGSDVTASRLGSPQPPWPKRPKRISAHVVNKNKVVVTRNTKAEHECRVKALNKKIRALYQELQRLHLIDPESPRGKNTWKHLAATERFAQTRAEFENKRLRKQVAESVAVQEQVRLLLLRQLELQSSRFTAVEFALIDDDARAFGSLKANLLKQQLQIENSLQRRLSDITRRSLLPRHAQARNKWGVAVTKQVLRMHVEELDVLPFNAAVMDAAIFQHTQEGSIPIDGDEVRCYFLKRPRAADVEMTH